MISWKQLSKLLLALTFAAILTGAGAAANIGDSWTYDYDTSWTVPSNAEQIYVVAIGGGGGGGGDGYCNEHAGEGGGLRWGYFEVGSDGQLSQGESISINQGDGGDAGDSDQDNSGEQTSSRKGKDGGDSSFGNYMTAYGGDGNGNDDESQCGTGGDGGGCGGDGGGNGAGGAAGYTGRGGQYCGDGNGGGAGSSCYNDETGGGGGVGLPYAGVNGQADGASCSKSAPGGGGGSGGQDGQCISDDEATPDAGDGGDYGGGGGTADCSVYGSGGRGGKGLVYIRVTDVEGISASNQYPEKGEDQISTSPTLVVDNIDNPRGSEVTVDFYNASGDSIIATTEARNGKAVVEWNGLAPQTSYSWYAKVSEGSETVTTSTWSFTTGNETPDDFNPYKNFEHRMRVNLSDKNAAPSYSSEGISHLTVDTSSLISSGKMENVCQDVRFADVDTTQILEFWVDKSTCNTATTDYYIDIPDDQAPIRQEHPIYMYYGNSSMERDSNYTVKQDYDMGLPGPVSVGTQSEHSCFIVKPSGRVKCSGRNNYGQLGDGSTTNSQTPVRVSGLKDVAGVATGRYHSCAYQTDGDMYCWGRNNHGQLGDGSTSNSATPVKVSGLSAVTDIAVGDDFTCAVTGSGNTKCWGNNPYGELGTGTRGRGVSSPTQVALGEGLGKAKMVAAGNSHTCAAESGSNDVYCWGRNNHGQLGDGTTSFSTTPKAVHGGEGLGNSVYVTANDYASCAIEDTGEVYCWGDGGQGKLGDGGTGDDTTPVQVHNGDGLNNAYAVQMASGDTVCALDTDGEILCWGDSQSIPGTSNNQPTPFLVSDTGEGMSEPVSLGTNQDGFCATDKDGNSYCWGENLYGEFGIGDTSDPSSPTRTHNYFFGGAFDRIPGDIREIPALSDRYGVSGFNNLKEGVEQSWMKISGLTMSDTKVY